MYSVCTALGKKIIKKVLDFSLDQIFYFQRKLLLYSSRLTVSMNNKYHIKCIYTLNDVITTINGVQMLA